MTPHINEYEKGNNIIYTRMYLTEYLKTETRVIIGDGMPEFVVKSVGKKIKLCCVKGGSISYKKAITTDRLKFVSDLSKEEVGKLRKMVAKINPDIIALSCVENSKGVLNAREDLGISSSTKIMAKIENEVGSYNIEEISKVADSIMIARGDLFINCGEKGFINAMERIIVECERKNCQYYMATDVLDGLVNDQLTRSELAEVFYLKNLTCKGDGIW